MEKSEENHPSSSSRGPQSWLFKPSPTEWLCLIGGALLVYCYAWLMDDAYVYFRYVDNFVVHGRGLVWNPGEYVEGFSSPVWAAVLIALRALHLNYWNAVCAVGVLSFVAFWWICCVVNRGFMSAKVSQESLNIPLVYLSFTYAVSCYFTSGLEAPLVNLTAAAYAAAILWPGNPLLQVVVGFSPLVRQELFIPFGIFCLFVRYFRGSSFPWWAIGSFVTTVGGYAIFRVWYYADLLPNTFYLKDLTWIEQGLKYLADTILPYHALPFAAAMSLALFTLYRKGGSQELRTTERLVQLLLAAPIVAYAVKIGGDPRHFRYLAFPFIVSVLATGGLFEHLIAGARERSVLLARLYVFVFAVLCVSNFPRQLDHHPLMRVPMKDINHQVDLIGDAAAHRLRFNQLTPPWRSGGTPSYISLSYSDAVRRFDAEGAQKQLFDTHPIGEKVPPTSIRFGKTLEGLPITSDSWCQNGYLHQALPVIHNLGLTEPFLGRTKMRSNRPAHKYGLRPLAHDILRIRGQFGFGRGVFDRAIAESQNPQKWIVKNIESLRMIENKVYNTHNFAENLRLALTPVRQIVP
jgi:hypothetical protein